MWECIEGGFWNFGPLYPFFPIQLISFELDEFGEMLTVPIPEEAVVCRTVVCYRIEEYDGKREKYSYFLSREPVCDYSKEPMRLISHLY